MLVELNKDNFEQETKFGLKLLEFYTTWCGYCKQQRIELEELKDSDMWIGLVDAEELPQVAQKYGIKGFPTFVLLKMVKNSRNSRISYKSPIAKQIDELY